MAEKSTYGELEQRVKELEKEAAELSKSDAGEQGLLSIATDITERKEMEERINHLNLVLRAIRNVNQLITREKDRNKLLQGICDILIETRGYHNAWIALFDEHKRLVTTAEAGLGNDLLPIINYLKSGKIANCGQKALVQSEVIAIEDPASTCADCPPSAMYTGRGGMTIRLEHEGRVYGLLSASIPRNYITNKEEHSSFQEVARDIAFALYNIGLEDDRIQAEEALTKSEEKYKLLVKNLPSIVYKGYKDWSVEFFDNKIESLIGYDVDKFNSGRMKWIDVIIEKDIETASKLFTQALKTDKSYVREYRVKPKSGKIIWIQERGQIVCDSKGELEYIAGVFFDITKSKRIEEALRESEEKYRSIMEAMNDAVYICSSDFRIEYMNSAMTEKIDRDAVGESCHKVLHGLDERCPWCSHGEVMQGEYVKKEIVSPKDAKTYHISNSPIFHTDGSISQLSIFRNITEVKKMIEQLQQSQKMESIGTLAGGIAHDFNNIIYSIIGYTDLTMDDMPEGSLAQSNLKEVLIAANRAKDMVQQILAFSRQTKIEKKPVKVQSVVKEAIKLLKTSIPTTIEIRQNIDEDCRPVMADPTQIHQVVMNLATNAYHAMREKGGVLTIDVVKEKISMDDSASYPDLHPGTYIKLTVSDTGHGIDKAVMEKIFDPYFTTKPVGEGTGMGLSTIHGIVKSHGGNIKVYSEPGKGTVFNVYFPLIETKPVEPKIVYTGPVQKGNERILLVDDQEQIVFMVKQTLERLGYQVATRTSSLYALEAFRAKPDEYDLVITDMTMPNMTGVELAPRLLEIKPDIPIILCTGFSEKISEAKSKAVGIRGFVMKPVIRSELAKKIREVLD